MNTRARSIGVNGLHGVAVAVIVLFLVAPGLIMIPLSLTNADFLSFPPRGISMRWYAAVLTDPEWLSAARNSLLIALAAAAVSLLCCIPAAIAIHKARIRWAEALVTLPMIVPHVVLGVGLYKVAIRSGTLGQAWAVVGPHALLFAPTAILTLLAVVSRLDPAYEDAAYTLGANRIATLRTVTLPLMLPGIITAGFFAFVLSFDELNVAYFLTHGSMNTVPKLLFEQSQDFLSPSLAVVSTLLIFLVFIILSAGGLTAGRITRRRSR